MNTCLLCGEPIPGGGLAAIRHRCRVVVPGRPVDPALDYPDLSLPPDHEAEQAEMGPYLAWLASQEPAALLQAVPAPAVQGPDEARPGLVEEEDGDPWLTVSWISENSAYDTPCSVTASWPGGTAS